MKVLILNSGLGTRMGEISSVQPKCMTRIDDKETVLSRQLKYIKEIGLNEVVITTGKFDELIKKYCSGLQLDLHISYILNPKYMETNYIYSIYSAKNVLDDDIILMHGDLVFSREVLRGIVEAKKSVMVVSTAIELPQKDFKAVIENGAIREIGVNCFINAVAAQPLYKIYRNDWQVWLKEIINYCENDKVDVYAENAFNEISKKIEIVPLDIRLELCKEIDNIGDLEKVRAELEGHK